MTSSRTIMRVGGAFGILAVIVNIPAYLAGIPDVSRVTGSVEDTNAFVLVNGLPPFVHIGLFLVFLSALTTMIRRVAPRDVIGTVVLVGGVVYAALSGAGVATEVAFATTRVRFPGVDLDANIFYFGATTAGWLFFYAGLGTVVMIAGTCAVAWRTTLFPRWATAVGVLAIVLLAIRLWFPLAGALASPAWFAVVGVLMMLAPSSSAYEEEPPSASGSAG